MNKDKSTNYKAFSLVELSIVLIIIGILVAGVSGGSKLVHNAKLQSVIDDVAKYKVAINTFKITYDAIPGDMVNAEDFFGADNTNNGNGDWIIPWDGHGGGTEQWITWVHLSLSGILSGSYSGQRSNGLLLIPDVDAPGVSLNDIATFRLMHTNANGESKNRLILVGNSYDVNANAEIKVHDAYHIDKKTDDGLSSSGDTLGISGNCLVDGNYGLATSSRVCSMYFSVQSLN